MKDLISFLLCPYSCWPATCLLYTFGRIELLNKTEEKAQTPNYQSHKQFGPMARSVVHL